MDAQVGRFLDWLETNGLRENTLIVFTSDNGMNMGHHGIYGKGNGTFPLNMFDTAVKVPTLISLPGCVPENQVCEDLLSHYDLMPTLLEYLGLENPESDTLPGRSFAPLLLGESLEDRGCIFVCDEYGPTRMIRNREWKYIHRYPYGPHELYDLVADPTEENNLVDSAEHRSCKEAMQANLDAWFVRYVDPARDVAHEAVYGRGQVGIVGPGATGKQRFADDVVYLSEIDTD
jgi:arylsulfatase A-like enzyme